MNDQNQRLTREQARRRHLYFRDVTEDVIHSEAEKPNFLVITKQAKAGIESNLKIERPLNGERQG